MRLWLIVATALGLIVTAALIGWTGYAEIIGAVTQVGWGLTAIVGFHLLQLAASALGWQALLAAPEGPGPGMVIGARWVREAANSLLSVAQIGGEVIGARLLHLGGVPLGTSGACVTVDLMMEMASQFVFTVLGLFLLITAQDDANVTLSAAIAIALAITIALALMKIRRSGLFKLIERALLWLSGKLEWPSLADMHRAVLTLCDDKKKLGIAFAWHAVSWLLGGFEVMLILHLVGVSIDLRQGLIIESLGQAIRAVGFFVPGSLGVQEGGYALICGVLGLGPAAGLEVSLLKRIRELVLGVPALVVWQVIEVRLLVAGSGKTAAVPVRAKGD